MRRLDGIANLMDISLSKFQELVMDREAWHATVHRVSSRTPLSELTDWLGDTALSDQHSVVNLMNYHMNPELVCQVRSWSLVSLPEVLVVVEVGV